MLRRKEEETKYLTRDESGRVELWQQRPTFVTVEDGCSFFVDQDNPENQLSLEDPIDEQISKMFILPENSCLEVKVSFRKNDFWVMVGQSDNYKWRKK